MQILAYRLNMERAINLISTNQATLFLGAGASMGVGGPSGGQLLNEITSHFDNVEYGSSTNFFDVCQDIIESGKYTRYDLEKFIKKSLEGLHPNDIHSHLAALPWKCIFTTNYDLIIERIPQNELKGRRIRVVKNNGSTIEYKKDLLYYFKIFGSIDTPSDLAGYPILSRTDSNISFSNRDFFYNILSDCIRQGPIIFIGYSFEDHLVFDLMAELYRTNKPDIIRESFAIIPSQPSPKVQRFFDQYNIKTIKATCEEFVDLVYPMFKDKPFKFTQCDNTIHIRGMPFDIPFAVAQSSKDNFIFLNSESTESKCKDMKSFFNNEDTSFYPYYSHWDFIREVYSFDGSLNPEKSSIYGKNILNGLKKHLFELINNSQIEKNAITFLSGPAGSGKTIILNRLAYDWYTSGYPVIIMKPQGNYVDYRQLDYFLEHLETRIKSTEGKRQNHSKARTLIICDNCSSFIEDYFRAFDFLTSRGRLFSMIFADRDNLLDNKIKENFVTYSLSETVSDNELNAFKEYLTNLNLIETEADLFGIIDNPDINESFFALMYTIIDETRRPLNKIIHDQYIRLADWPKNIYEYVCLFNNYNINPSEDLLVRCSGQKYETFLKEVEKGQLEKVIFYESNEDDNIEYRVHHPIIAQRTVQFELMEPTIKAQKFIEIISKVNESYSVEVKKIEKLLVTGAGSNSHYKDLNLNLKKDIFEIACSKIKSRVLFHHYALLELEGNDKNYEKAESLLKTALSIKDPFERDENIYTSLGKLYSSKGQYLEAQNEHDESLEAYRIAESNFKRGRTGHFKNKNSYHGQIVLYSRESEQITDELEKFKLYSKALDLCEEAICSLNEKDQFIFYNEKFSILTSLKRIEDFEALIETLATQYQSAIGYKVKAYLMYTDLLGSCNKKLIETEENLRILNDIQNIVDEGLIVDDTNSDLLRLQATIGLVKYKNDPDVQYELLNKWYMFKTYSDINLQYNYGILLFYREYYNESKRIFTELGSLSQWVLSRSSMSDAHYFTENGVIKEFEGEIIEINAERTRGSIKILSLDNLDYPIIFFPRFFASINDRVLCKIGFNLRGSFAADVRKD
ncbi:SIR2 family protein [Methanogenium marinum]|uniref:SIR2 family protein n=1 Tax=Methanogenium marinum TaxID=348610 RepID=A0A9Q4KT40_9EURY|nr:SIR2 family protein [Methanogenium marinum]MDE4908194.1 SIR2 family protein [Methanogenium marinum]